MASIKCPHCNKQTGVVPPLYNCEHCQKSLRQQNAPIPPPPIPANQEKNIFDTGSNDKKVDIVPPPIVNSNEPTIFDSSNKQTPPPVPQKQAVFSIEDIFGNDKAPPPLPNADKQLSNYQQHKNETAEHQGRQKAAWLIVHAKDKPTISYTLYVGENVFGRPSANYQCDIPIDDEYVSRSHAVIHIETDSIGRFNYQLLDNGAKRSGKASSNGTFINGNDTRIAASGKVFLLDGDAIQVGYTTLVFKTLETTKNVQEAVSMVKDMEYTQIVDLNKKT